MKLSTRNLSLVVALVAVSAFNACMDKDLDLNNISTEVTVASGDLALPLGELQKQFIGDLLNTDEMEGFDKDENGVYRFGYADGDLIKIDGITTSFDIPKEMATTTLDYPDFTISEDIVVDSAPFVIPVPDEIALFGSQLPQTISGIKFENIAHYTDLDFQFDMPAQIKHIDQIIFQEGSKIEVVFDLGGLAPINSNGVLDITVTTPEGFIMKDDAGNTISDGIYTIHKEIDAGTQSVPISVYVTGIDCASYAPAAGEHTMHIEDRISYTLDYSFDALGGVEFDPSVKPSLTPHAELIYKDALVTTATIVLDGDAEGTEHSISNDIQFEVPDGMIAAIESVSFTESALNLKVDGLEHFNQQLFETVLKDVMLHISLPEVLKFDVLQKTVTVTDGHILNATLSDLSQGITLTLNGIELPEDQQTPVKVNEGGVEKSVMKIALPLSYRIDALPDDAHFWVSQVVSDEKHIEIAAGIEQTSVTIDKVVGRIDYSPEIEDMTIELGGISDMDISVNKFDISPVIKFNVTNPIGVELGASIVITPWSGGQAIEENSVTIEELTILPAVEKTPVTTSITIAKESAPAALPLGELWKPANLTRLFNGKLPDSISVHIDIHTDPTKDCVIYPSSEGWNVDYDYDVDIPFDFGPDLWLTYSTKAEGLSDTFAQLVDLDIKVGDITIIADITNTTPLDLTVNAKLLNADGTESDARLIIADGFNTVRGAADGNQTVSRVALTLSLGEGKSMKALENADAVELVLDAKSASSGGGPLKDDQWISASMKLNIKGGLTLDIKGLLNGSAPEEQM